MIRHELRLMLLALQFLTRVPVPARVGFTPQWQADSARHFPLVGVFIGLLGAGVLWLAALLFPLPVAVLLSMVATLLVTGAFHEDGLADTFDALGGAVGRERALQIMKDSRIGTYGAVALVLVLGLKATTLASLPLGWALLALVMGHSVSRSMAVLLMHFLPYAGDIAHAKTAAVAQGVSGRDCFIACLWGLAASVLAWACDPAVWQAVTSGMVLAAVGAWACGMWYRRRLGGITGDTLGAAQQLTELLVLLGWLVWAPH